MIKAVVGSGGKTSLIRKLAKEYREQGKKVLVITSTHMLIEEDTLISDDAGEIIQKLECEHYVMAGRKDGVKIGPLSQETYHEVCNFADIVFVEADGSKHLPVKYPNEREPVIYPNVDEIIVVSGLHALGRTITEAAHRKELVKACLEAEDSTILKASHIQKLIRKGYIELLKEKYPNTKITISPSHDTSLYQRVIAKMMKEDIDVSIIKEEWFEPQPQLIICGAGHVGREVAKIASRMDFYIKVIDDRKTFANRENLPEADEVICDSFENLEKYLDEHGYYVVATRGHQADFGCLRTIISHSYNYLGMIGSKAKVKASFEHLRECGIEEEKIATVHAPIGLAINANTPAEIAISILAEIIKEKNQRFSSFISRELLNTKEKGTLCIIIEKNGSAPRGVGSMMFVTDKGVIDSIGGGAVEFAAIKDAKNIDRITVKEYHLNQAESANLGMICGGSNKVLLIPLE